MRTLLGYKGISTCPIEAHLRNYHASIGWMKKTDRVYVLAILDQLNFTYTCGFVFFFFGFSQKKS